MSTELIHGMLDQHYLATLNQPVGMLDNLTPREAVESPKGRKKVAEWPKFIENRADQHPNDDDPNWFVAG